MSIWDESEEEPRNQSATIHHIWASDNEGGCTHVHFPRQNPEQRSVKIYDARSTHDRQAIPFHEIKKHLKLSAA